jgi:hypothetical protein
VGSGQSHALERARHSSSVERLLRDSVAHEGAGADLSTSALRRIRQLRTARYAPVESSSVNRCLK